MAEDFGGFESFSGAPSGKEKAKESQEQSQERYRQAQAAIKQIRQEEARKKQDDNSLAQIIVHFLNDPSHTQLFLLMSRLIAKNIPSDLILVVISLINEPARKLIEEKFTENFRKLESPLKTNTSKESQIRIDDWINKIFAVATAEPHRLLETALENENKVEPNLVQLSAFVLREFLETEENKETNYDNMHSFCMTFWEKLINQLESQVDYQKLLNTGDIDSLENE